jgi:hypothetical protein
LLLPEILMALWTILVLYSFLTGRKLLYFIFASLMLLTKESGFVLIVAIFTVRASLLLLNKEKKSPAPILMKLLVVVSPLIFPLIFFVIQKIRFGWFFFPEHMKLISFNPNHIYSKFKIAAKIVFFIDGRWFISVVLISVILYFLISLKYFTSKYNWLKKEMLPLIYILVFIVYYFAFCLINFFTARYLLLILPFIIFLFVYSFVKIIPYKLITIPVFALAFFFSVLSFYRNTNIQDVSINYADAVRVQKATVNYLEINNYREKKIWVPYLMLASLNEKSTAYLSGDKEFKNLTTNLEDNADAYVTLDFDNDTSVFNDFKRKKKLKLIRSFEKGLAKSEIYIP